MTRHIVETAREQGQRVVYHSCHPGVRTSPKESHPDLQVILSIVYQIRLLSSKPNILRHRYQEFRARVEDEEWRYQDDGTIVMEHAVDLLPNFPLEMENVTTVFIVLDGVACATRSFRISWSQ